MTFHMNDSPEEAVVKVQNLIRFGQQRPDRTPAQVREKFGGGVFYALPLHWGVPVPR